MQQTTIRFDEELQVQQPVDVMAPVRNAVQVINNRYGFFHSQEKKSAKSLQGSKIYRNFAASKINSGMMPHFLMGVRLLYSQTLSKKVFTKYCAVSGSGNTPGSLLLNFRQHVAQFFMSKNNSMNSSVLTMRNARRAFSVREWMDAKGLCFSALPQKWQETVVMNLLVAVLMTMVVCLVQAPVVSALMAVAAVALTWRLNQFPDTGKMVEDVTSVTGKEVAA